MSVIKEWNCPRHGYFEATHPICNGDGCDSSGVERTFVTPPGYRSPRTAATDASARQTAQAYGLADIKTTRDAQRMPAPDAGIKWGDEAMAMVGGQKPFLQAAGPKTGVFQTIKDNCVMPPTQFTTSATDAADRAKVSKA